MLRVRHGTQSALCVPAPEPRRPRCVTQNKRSTPISFLKSRHSNVGVTQVPVATARTFSRCNTIVPTAGGAVRLLLLLVLYIYPLFKSRPVKTLAMTSTFPICHSVRS